MNLVAWDMLENPTRNDFTNLGSHSRFGFRGSAPTMERQMEQAWEMNGNPKA